MKRKTVSQWSWALLALFGFGALDCAPGGGPRVDSQTNWLRACVADADCGELRCLCGACTRTCSNEGQCTDLEGANCVPPDESGAVALCDGSVSASAGYCLPRCLPGQCADGAACISGICSPIAEATARVTLQRTSRFQSLVGLGASIAYVSDEIALHPRKTALFEVMFAGLGLDMLRLRNTYGYTGDDALTSQSEIVAAAASSLGRPPVVMLTSWSPPAALKANGASQCAGELQTCTLSKTSAGAFDYQGFAAHWRASLDAYAKVGVSADFIGIQNHPNWTPPASTPMEACLFLPREGTRTISVDGGNVQVTFPGFAEAMSAVAGQLTGLAHVPEFAAPEVNGAAVVAEFAPELDFSRVAAVAHHVYDFDPAAIDAGAFMTVSDVARQYQRPVFLTEGVADGFGTAVLLHYALVVEGASVYLQNDLVGSAFDTTKDAKALLSLSSDDFTTQAPYHALRHFAYHTDSKWVRIGATSTRSHLLSSAWLSPDETSLTVVLVNTGPNVENAELELDAFSFTDSQVVRTVFDGAERFSELGALPVERIVRVPSRSVLTVALSRKE